MKSLEWAAGLYEGEGCLTLCTRNYNGKKYKYPNVKISMTDTEPLKTFQMCVGGLGKIYGPYNYNGVDNKCIWEYRISTTEGVKTFLSLLYPLLLKSKRRQVRIILDECEDWD